MKRPIVLEINKAKVILYPIESVRSIEINVMVNIGSWYEVPKNFGISHFLEHMLFHGTKTMPSAEVMTNFTKENGIYTNAYTNGKNINFYLNVPDINLNKGLEILEQVIFYPLLPEEKIKNESNIIIQELKSYLDKPETRFYNQTDEILFGKDHIYTRDTLGNIESIQKINQQDLKNLHQKYFQPQNLTISIVGNIKNSPQLIKKLNQILNPHQNTYKSKLKYPLIKPSPQKTLIFHDKPDQETIYLTWILDKDRKYNRLERISRDIFSKTLGNGMDSLLFKTFRLKYGLVYSIRSRVTNYKNCSIFEISSQIDPSNSQKFFEIFDAEFEQIIDTLTKDMFNKTIKYTDYQSLMTYDSVREISEMIINESIKNKTIYLPEDYIKLSKKINFDKTYAFFKERLTKENQYTFCMTPIKPEP